MTTTVYLLAVLCVIFALIVAIEKLSIKKLYANHGKDELKVMLIII